MTLSDDNFVPIDLEELNDLLEEISQLEHKLCTANNLIDETMTLGISRGTVVSAEAVFDDVLNPDYPTLSYTNHPSKINLSVGMEGLIKGTFTLIGKLIEGIFKILGFLLSSLGKLISWMAGAGGGKSLNTYSASGGSDSGSKTISVKTKVRLQSDALGKIANSDAKSVVKDISDLIRTLAPAFGIKSEPLKTLISGNEERIGRLGDTVENYRGSLSEALILDKNATKDSAGQSFNEYENCISSVITAIDLYLDNMEKLDKVLTSDGPDRSSEIGKLLYGEDMRLAVHGSGGGQRDANSGKNAVASNLDAILASYTDNLYKNHVSKIYGACRSGSAIAYQAVRNMGGDAIRSGKDYLRRINVIDELIRNSKLAPAKTIYISSVLSMDDSFLSKVTDYEKDITDRSKKIETIKRRTSDSVEKWKSKQDKRIETLSKENKTVDIDAIKNGISFQTNVITTAMRTYNVGASVLSSVSATAMKIISTTAMDIIKNKNNTNKFAESMNDNMTKLLSSAEK